jgi:hypothetical protein
MAVDKKAKLLSEVVLESQVWLIDTNAILAAFLFISLLTTIFKEFVYILAGLTFLCVYTHFGLRHFHWKHYLRSTSALRKLKEKILSAQKEYDKEVWGE